MKKQDLTVSPFIRGKIQVIQKKEGYRFGIDSPLLASFVKLSRRGRLIDLGTGSGILILLLNLKYKNIEYHALELQPDLFQIAQKNFQLNNIKVNLKLGNVKDIKKLYPSQYFDYVVSNPPFYKSSMEKSKNEEIKIAKAEIKASLEDFIYASSYLLKNKGKLFIINNINRFSETVILLKKYKIQPKRIRIVYPTLDENATNFLIEGLKGGKEGGEVMEKPLIIYKNPKEKQYTEEVQFVLENFC